MSRYQGRRYEEKEQINITKVVGVFIAIAVIVGLVFAIKNLFSDDSPNTEESKTIATQYYAAYENEKWGVINSNGETVINPQYDELIVVPDATKDLFIITYDVNYEDESYKTKVLNQSGEELFSQYDEIEAIANEDENARKWYESNVLKVKKDGKYGLINFEGKEILPIEYTEISPLKGLERSLLIQKEDQIGLYNHISEQIVIEPKFAEIKALGETYDYGYIVKDHEGKFGVISPDKKVILENKYEDIKQVSGNDMYVVTENKKLKLINSKEEEILTTGFEDIVDINGEDIIIQSQNKYGVMNTSGEKTVDTIYDSLQPVYSEYYIASKDSKYGIIDKNGEVKKDFEYFSLLYRDDSGWIEGEKDAVETEIIDRNLETRIKGIVTEVSKEKGYARIRVDDEYRYYNFKFEEKESKDVLLGNTLFLVKQDGKYGFQNKDGEFIVDCIYDDATEQNAFGYAAIKKDGVWGAIKADGTVILEPSVNLDENEKIDFIGNWHLYKDSTLNAYAK